MKSKFLCNLFAVLLIYFGITNYFVLLDISTMGMKTSENYFTLSSIRNWCEIFAGVLLIVNTTRTENV
jgi:hypothetical protein